MKFRNDSPTDVVFDRRAPPLALTQPAQRVLGLEIVYPFGLRENTERARLVRAHVRPEIATHLASLEVFDARGSGLITDVGIYRYTFGLGAPLTLDAIAQGSAEHLVRLKGVRDPRHFIRALLVSELDARWVSFCADRWDGKVGVEALDILDFTTQTLWTVRIAYAKRPPLYPLIANFALYRARAGTRRILASISVPAAQARNNPAHDKRRTHA
jgi:hypothetical protein